MRSRSESVLSSPSTNAASSTRVEAGLVGGKEVDRVVAFVGERLVERVGVVGGGGGECLEDLFDRRVGALGEFGRGG